jgi:solute carrier family 6 amino acid transporter-like protein 5/7/9/14
MTLFLFSNYILNKSQGFDFISTMEWPLVLSLLAAWLLVFVCLCRGIKYSGKVRKTN